MPSIPFERAVRMALVPLLVLSLSVPAARAGAQSSSDASVCLGFAFGSWTPALDWRAAGHASAIDSRSHARAEDGRDWATTQHVESDSTILLLPAWWPAGVNVTLPTRAPALGDTIVGRAFAYVADSRRTAPTTRVRAWRVPCGARARIPRPNR